MDIIQPSCPTCCDGKITITVEKPGVFFSIDNGTSWHGADVAFGTYKTFQNLCAGVYHIRVAPQNGIKNLQCHKTIKIELIGDGTSCYTDETLDCTIPDGFAYVETKDFTSFPKNSGDETFSIIACCNNTEVPVCQEVITVVINTDLVTSLTNYLDAIVGVIEGTYDTTQVQVVRTGNRLRFLFKNGFIPGGCPCSKYTFSYSSSIGRGSVDFDNKTLQCCAYENDCTNATDTFSIKTTFGVCSTTEPIIGTVRFNLTCGSHFTNTIDLGSYPGNGGNYLTEIQDLFAWINAQAVLGGYNIVFGIDNITDSGDCRTVYATLQFGFSLLPEGCNCESSSVIMEIRNLPSIIEYTFDLLNCCKSGCPECPECPTCPDCNADCETCTSYRAIFDLTGMLYDGAILLLTDIATDDICTSVDPNTKIFNTLTSFEDQVAALATDINTFSDPGISASSIGQILIIQWDAPALLPTCCGGTIDWSVEDTAFVDPQPAQYKTSTPTCTPVCPEPNVECPCVNPPGFFSVIFKITHQTNPLDTFRLSFLLDCNGTVVSFDGNPFFGDPDYDVFRDNIITSFNGVAYPIGGTYVNPDKIRILIPNSVLGVCTCETIDLVSVSVVDGNDITEQVAIETFIPEKDCCDREKEFPCGEGGGDCPECYCINPLGDYSFLDVVIPFAWASNSPCAIVSVTPTIAKFEILCNNIVVYTETNYINLQSETAFVQSLKDNFTNFNAARPNPGVYNFFVDQDWLLNTAGVVCPCDKVQLRVTTEVDCATGWQQTFQSALRTMNCCEGNTFPCEAIYGCQGTACLQPPGYFAVSYNMPSFYVYGQYTQLTLYVLCPNLNSSVYIYVGPVHTPSLSLNPTNIISDLTGSVAYTYYDNLAEKLYIGVPQSVLGSCPCDNAVIAIYYNAPGFPPYVPPQYNLLFQNAYKPLNCCAGKCPPITTTSGGNECNSNIFFETGYYSDVSGQDFYNSGTYTPESGYGILQKNTTVGSLTNGKYRAIFNALKGCIDDDCCPTLIAMDAPRILGGYLQSGANHRYKFYNAANTQIAQSANGLNNQALNVPIQACDGVFELYFTIEIEAGPMYVDYTLTSGTVYLVGFTIKCGSVITKVHMILTDTFTLNFV